jgi:MFS family permease
VVVIGFTLAEGIVWALNGPAWLSVVPHLVPRPLLPSAVAANSVQFNLGRLIGPVVAGMVVAGMGLSWAFTINALTFVPLLFVLFRLPAGKTRTHSPSAEHPPLMKDLSAGLKLVWKHPGLRRLSIMLGVTQFLAAPAQGLLAPYVQQRMNGGSDAFGWMLGAIGLGALIGAMVIRRVPAYYPRHHLIPLATCVAAVAMFLFTFARSPWVGFLALVGMGFFWMLALNSTNAAMQLLAEDESRGRVMSVMLLCNTGCLPLGHLCAAGLASVMGTQWVMRVMEGALVLAAAGFLLWREPAIDAMQRQKENLGWWKGLWEAVTAQSHRPVPAPVREEVAREEGGRAERVIG